MRHAYDAERQLLQMRQLRRYFGLQLTRSNWVGNEKRASGNANALFHFGKASRHIRQAAAFEPPRSDRIAEYPSSSTASPITIHIT